MENTSIKIICFAGLRKYFGSETSIKVNSDITYSEIIKELIVIKPEAKEVLNSSRIAVNEEFVQLNNKITPEETLFLIPPSSGG